MPDPLDDETPPRTPHELSEEVGAKESRKVRARRNTDKTVWMAVGMFGLIGWSIAVPTLIGIALGLWLDWIWPGQFSWTLALLLAGVTLGCLNAWHWVSHERAVIDQEEQEAK